MKRFAATLALACAAALAQAAAIDWTEVGSSANQTITLEGSHTPSTGFSVAIAFNLTSPQASGDTPNYFVSVMSPSLCAGIGLGSMSDGSGSGARLTLSVDGSAPNGWKYNINQGSGGANFREGTNVVGIRFSVEGNTTQIDWYINGTLIDSLGSFYTGSFADAAFDEIVLGAGVGDDVTVYYADGVATEANFDAIFVPEPTALALLALGVAGLALRRRAA